MDDVPGARAPLPPAPAAGACSGGRLDGWLALALAAPVTPALCRRLRDLPDLERLGARLAAATGTDRRAARRARDALVAPGGPLTPKHVAALGTALTARRVAEAREWRAGDPHRRHLVPIDDPRYPTSLRASLDPPPLLHLLGDPSALAGPAVAIVGSREASHAALELARALGHELAAAGVVVVSGLALGTDGAAHAGAIDGALPGLPPTLAFTGTGVDLVYPRRHERLARALLERGGAIASEFPLRHPPQPWCFPQRNRLISGTSLGVVVVEAALPSGSLTTARHALEQGREVMAVPGPVDNPRSAGCHALIRDGATLVTSAADVLGALEAPLRRALAEADAYGRSGTEAGTAPAEPARAAPLAGALPSVPGTRVAPGAPPSDPAERCVWDCLEGGAATLDRLVVRSALAVPALLAAIGALELAGRIVVERDGRYARRHSDA